MAEKKLILTRSLHIASVSFIIRIKKCPTLCSAPSHTRWCGWHTFAVSREIYFHCLPGISRWTTGVKWIDSVPSVGSNSNGRYTKGVFREKYRPRNTRIHAMNWCDICDICDVMWCDVMRWTDVMYRTITHDRVNNASIATFFSSVNSNRNFNSFDMTCTYNWVISCLLSMI
jgi:hypothetical protein